MSSPFGYSYQDATRSVVTLNVQRIDNFNSVFSTSGTLSIQLWATTAPYNGVGTLFGNKIAEVNIGQLQGGFFFSNIFRTVTLSNLPATGTYNIVFVLAEFNGFQNLTVDYGNLPLLQQIGTITAPSIITQPVSQTVNSGSGVTFSVFATGSSPLSYQWYVSFNNGVSYSVLPSATSSTLSFGSNTTANSGELYIVRVSNSAGVIDSVAARLTVVVPATIPVIVNQPVSQTVASGSAVTFSVVASGTAPLSYQWRKDGGAIGGATSNTLSLTNATTVNGGRYSVVVTNTVGSATSSEATLSVTAASTQPSMTTQPASVNVSVGGNATFSVSATGTAPLSFQWSKNGVSIPGATSGTLTLSNVQPTDAGNYTAVVGNVAGNTTSNAATLTVNVPAAISAQPISQTVNAGTAATFTAAATGTAPLTYQWRKDGTPILGATIATFTLSSVQPTDAAAYTVVISNPAGSSTSNVAILAVTIPNPGRLINLSVLTDIATAGDDFTLGYVVGGNSTSGAKPLVIRAAGPSLGALGVPGTLDDPKLELFAGSTKSSENDNWGGSPQLTTALAAVGAFAYTGPTSKDAATTASITTRDNSVRVSAAGSGTGAVIAEIYDATPAASFTTATPRLINVSVRKHLGSGLTMGFVVGGATPAKVLVRGIGPTLGAFGVPGTVVDPQLTLFNSSSVKIGENNDWAGTAELTAAFANVGAFALPATSKDAALLVTLAPGNYTAQVNGVNGTTGVALVEVYEVP
jgi:hypothetical protein